MIAIVIAVLIDKLGLCGGKCDGGGSTHDSNES